MNGLKMNYEKYLQSLESMQEPVVPKAKLNMRGALEYARSKGCTIAELSQKEKDMFVTYLKTN